MVAATQSVYESAAGSEHRGQVVAVGNHVLNTRPWVWSLDLGEAGEPLKLQAEGKSFGDADAYMRILCW